MKYFPINLQIADRKCTVIGGGKVAARKIEALLECGGKVLVLSPQLTSDLQELHRDGRIEWEQRSYRQGDLHGAFLVIAATDDEQAQKNVFKEAEANGQLINVADVPQLCNFILPASLNRDDLTVTVSTAGKSPALAGKLRRELEKTIGPEHGTLVKMMGLLRPVVLDKGRPHEENRETFRKLLHDDFADWIRQGNWFMIERHLTATLGGNIDPKCLNTLKKMLDCD